MSANDLSVYTVPLPPPSVLTVNCDASLKFTTDKIIPGTEKFVYEYVSIYFIIDPIGLLLIASVSLFIKNNTLGEEHRAPLPIISLFCFLFDLLHDLGLHLLPFFRSLAGTQFAVLDIAEGAHGASVSESAQRLESRSIQIQNGI